MSRPGFFPLLALTLSVLLTGGCNPGTPHRDEARPSVVLITIDALRADSLSIAGHPSIETPNLDRLAAEGTVFSQAISSFVGTTAAMPSLMTGRFPSFQGITEWNTTTHFGFAHLNGPGEAGKLAAQVQTLAEIFTANGYASAGFNTNPNLGRQSNFHQGFLHYDDFRGDLDARSRRRQHSLEGHYPPADVVVDHVVEWLASRPVQPVFLWVHLMDPHSPYLPPPPFHRLQERSYTPASDLQINEALYEILIGQYRETPPARYPRVEALPGSVEKSLEHLKALYEGEVRFTDHQLGRLFKALDRAGLGTDSMVVVTADHGEEFFDHGHVSHHLLEPAFEELIRIPLILRLPAGSAAPRHVEELVRMVDIAPTVLDCAGLAPETIHMDGVSLQPLIQGREMAELSAFVSAIDFGVVRTSRWKYRRIKRPFGTHQPGEALFDIVDDPLESRDLATDLPEVLADMRQRYEAFVDRLELRGSPAPDPEAEAPEIDPELEERLRGLGYVE